MSKNNTLLSIDQGTTSSRAILFSENGDILDVHQKELEIIYPHKGWIEQDANAIWNDTIWAYYKPTRNNHFMGS